MLIECPECHGAHTAPKYPGVGGCDRCRGNGVIEMDNYIDVIEKKMNDAYISEGLDIWAIEYGQFLIDEVKKHKTFQDEVEKRLDITEKKLANAEARIKLLGVLTGRTDITDLPLEVLMDGERPNADEEE